MKDAQDRLAVFLIRFVHKNVVLSFPSCYTTFQDNKLSLK